MSNFTANGYVRRSPEQIKQSLNDYMVSVNPTYKEMPADVQNNLLDTSVAILSEIENICADVANSFSPSFANSNDFMWEQQAAAFGLKYKNATLSSVTLKFTGRPGLYIPKDTEVSEGFKTIEAITLNSTGMGYVKAESENEGTFEPDTINEVLSNVSEDLQVTNPTSSLPSENEETLEELKKRTHMLIKSPRVGGTDYAKTQLIKLEGVSERLINFTFMSSNTIRGVEVIVGGGNPNEVANAIFQSFLTTGNLVSKPSNNEVERTANFTIDYFGSKIPITWTLPKELSLNITVNLSFRYVNVYTATLQARMEQEFALFLNNLKVGSALNLASFNSIVYRLIEEMDVDLQYLSNATYIIQSTQQQEVGIDEFGYIKGIEKDVYVTLSMLKLDVGNV